MGLLRILVRVFKANSRKRTYTQPPRIRAAADNAVDEAFVWRCETAASYVEKAKLETTILKGRCWVIDGDTIVIDKVRIRLAGIDAPELEHPWGQKSKWALVELCRGKTITAQVRPEMSHDRVVAECFLPDGGDLAAELVQRGLALDWSKFSGGKYRHLEPPDARRKLWRADARQKGRLHTTSDS